MSGFIVEDDGENYRVKYEDILEIDVTKGISKLLDYFFGPTMAQTFDNVVKMEARNHESTGRAGNKEQRRPQGSNGEGSIGASGRAEIHREEDGTVPDKAGE